MKAKKHVQRSGLNCAYCGKEFKYESERKRHEQSHSPQFECKVCAKKFSFLSAVRRHEKQHERTGSVFCDECNRKFRDESLLKRHMKYAHKGSFKCTKCNTTFSSELALRAHTKTHRPESERQFRCSYPGCAKTFNFTHHLKHHELTHTNTKQHYCNICGKGFIQSHHLKSHQRKHEPEDWLMCEITGCKKRFPTEYALKRHVATHKDIKSEDIDDVSSERKSSCDVSELIAPDTVTCVSCDQVILRDQFTEHVKGCIVNKESASLDDNSNITQNTLVKSEVVRIDFEDDISSCKSYVGGCIMEADANGNDKCLCAQISANNTHLYELTSKEINTQTTELQQSDALKTNEKDKNSDICEGCECDSNKNASKMNPFVRKTERFDNPTIADDAPKIEYRNDGTIRLKDTFDIDVPSGNVQDSFDIPYNSCKAVLGKCIVSGNGTMDEGCLCARMAMDDQQMIAQEIDELTPCPK